MNYRNANSPPKIPSPMAWNEMRDAVREHLCLEDALHVVVLSLPQELWRSPLPSWPTGAGTPAWPGTLQALPTGTSLCTCRVSWRLKRKAVLAASIATSACSGCTILVLLCIFLALNILLFLFLSFHRAAHYPGPARGVGCHREQSHCAAL